MSELYDSSALLAIEPGQLSEDALRGLVEEFVSRSGTDYGRVEATLEAKVSSVIHQLQSGEVVLVFNGEENSCEIVTAQKWRQWQAEQANE